LLVVRREPAQTGRISRASTRAVSVPNRHAQLCHDRKTATGRGTVLCRILPGARRRSAQMSVEQAVSAAVDRQLCAATCRPERPFAASCGNARNDPQPISAGQQADRHKIPEQLGLKLPRARRAMHHRCARLDGGFLAVDALRVDLPWPKDRRQPPGPWVVRWATPPALDRSSRADRRPVRRRPYKAVKAGLTQR
jgi:hypothetical protein